MAQRNARAPLGGAAGRTFDDGSDDDGGEVTLGHQLSAKRNGFAERKRATADRASSAFAWEAAKAAGGHKRQRSWEAPREEEDGEDEDDEAGSGDDDAPRAASARRFQRGGSGSSEDSGDDDDGEEDGEDGSGGGPGGKRKRNKHAPAEMPTNKPVRRFRMAVDVPKVIRRDPRFDNLSGKFDERNFRTAYGFLGAVKDNEIAALKRELSGGAKGAAGSRESRRAAAAMPAERRAELQRLLTQLQQQRGEERVSAAVRDALAARKAEERRAVAAGKTPYFPKRKELRELAATERYKALEARGDGAVAKALKKRRKKLAGKERKAAPFPSRRGVDASEGR